MALEAGVMSVTLEYAQGLADKDFFGRQDPYCIIRAGGQKFQSKTATDGGRNPVWNETFSFNLINENNIDVEVKDEDDIGRDDLIGSATFSLARARQTGQDRIQAPVKCGKKSKQQGLISISLKWEPNRSIVPHATPHAAYPAAQPPLPAMMPPPPPYAAPYYYPAAPYPPAAAMPHPVAPGMPSYR